jgi:hypothetical protein
MATNTDLVNLNNTLKTFYNSYISDNKYYLNYLADITNKSLTDENKFNRKIQQLFLLNINDVTTLIIDKTNPTSLMDEGLGSILDEINLILESFNNFISTDNDCVKNYNNIKSITLVSANAATGVINSNVLTLTNNFTILTTGTFYKNGDTKHPYVNRIDSMNNQTIIKNLIYYLLNMTQFNIKIQVNALLGYYKLVKHYYDIYKHSEELMFTPKGIAQSNPLTAICTAINTSITDLITDANSYIVVESFVEKFTVTPPDLKNGCLISSATNKSSGKLISINPFRIKLTTYTVSADGLVKTYSDYLKINCKIFDITDYVLVYDSKRIPIKSCEFEENDNGKYISSIVLDDYDSQSANASNIFTLKINNVFDATLYFDKKNLGDLKKDFVSGGEKLKENNMNIENYRKQINKTVNVFKRNEERLNILNIQLNIYYCVYGIIIFTLIGLANYPMLNRTKQLIVLAIIVIVIIMIIVNYFIQSRYIEEFKENFFVTPVCADLVSTYDKITYIQNIINTFLPQSKLYLSNLMAYLPLLDSFDLYKQLTTSIKKEKKTFNNIQNYYFNKEKEAIEYTQLLNQQVLNKSSYIFLISYIFLVISLVYLSYLVIPDYIKLFLFIGLLFVIFILWIYIYNTVDIVRTNSYNKYWIKPSNQTISDLGAK